MQERCETIASMAAKRAYGGQSAQERASARRGRLIDAGLVLLRQGGIAKITVTGSCAEAGLTERYFYESFANRDELIDAVLETNAIATAAQMFATVDMAPNDVPTRVRLAVEMTIDAAISEFGGDIKDIDRQTLLRRRAAMTKITVDLAKQYAHILFGPVEDSAEMTMAVMYVVGGATELVISWLLGTLDVTRDELVATVTFLITTSVTGILEGARQRESGYRPESVAD